MHTQPPCNTEMTQNYVISHNTYDIQYEKRTQKHIDSPTHGFLFNKYYIDIKQN